MVSLVDGESATKQRRQTMKPSTLQAAREIAAVEFAKSAAITSVTVELSFGITVTIDRDLVCRMA